ncbi:hypothetical protein HDU67_007293 [Dinochytrium kinnereticum]|nr:hypothetical protein HDU67_007293 [Dinochytrium kinnereticum]
MLLSLDADPLWRIFHFLHHPDSSRLTETCRSLAAFFRGTNALLRSQMEVEWKDGWTPTGWAAWKGADAVLQRIISNHLKLFRESKRPLQLILQEPCGPDGKTPLEWAAEAGHLEACKILVEEGRCAVQSLESRWDPLNLSARFSHIDVALYLLSKKACPSWMSKTWTDRTELEEELVHAHQMTHPAYVGMKALHWASFNGLPDLCQAFIAAGADLEEPCLIDGRSPLQLAACMGHAEVCRFLVKAGADINSYSQDDFGWNFCMPAVGAAVCTDRVETLETLFSMGASLDVRIMNRSLLQLAVGRSANACSNWLISRLPSKVILAKNHIGRTVLHEASLKSDPTLCRIFLDFKLFDIEEVDAEGNTPLYLAALSGNVETLKLLLSRGANPAVVDAEGATVLAACVLVEKPNAVCEDVVRALAMYPSALARHGTLESPLAIALFQENDVIAKLLIDAGAPLENANANGDTAVDFAIAHKRYDMLEYILCNRPDAVLLVDDDGCPPISVAAGNGNVEAMRILLRHGSPYNATDFSISKPSIKMIWSPLCKAVIHRHLEAVELLLSLLPSPDLTMKANSGFPFLLQAAGVKHLPVCRLLVDHGAPIDEEAIGTRRNALHAAAAGGDDEVVDYLARVYKERGISLDVKDADGFTALHFAASGGHESALKTLAGLGANLGAKTKLGKTPAEIASMKGHANTSKLLLKLLSDESIGSKDTRG